MARNAELQKKTAYDSLNSTNDMKTIAEVKKQGNESPAALIRRFTKRVQGTKALMKVRGERYYERKLSKLKTKRRALVVLEKTKVYDRLKKLGKLPEKAEGHKRR